MSKLYNCHTTRGNYSLYWDSAVECSFFVMVLGYFLIHDVITKEESDCKEYVLDKHYS